MAIDKEAVSKLIKEHEAIRVSMKWLDISINNMIPNPPVPNCSQQQLEIIRDNLKNLLLYLHNLQFGIKDHLARDQKVLREVADNISLEEIDKDHEKIERDFAQAITQTELATAEKWHENELIQYLVKIRESIHNTYNLIEEHTLEEDSAFKKVLMI